jgi:hypothetical protein
MSIISRARGKAGHRKNGVSSQLSKSTLWRRARGRPTLKDKAIRLQYLCLSSSLAQLQSEFVSADHVSILMNQA